MEICSSEAGTRAELLRGNSIGKLQCFRRHAAEAETRWRAISAQSASVISWRIARWRASRDPADLSDREAATAWGHGCPCADARLIELEQMRCDLFWPSACWSPCVLLPMPPRSITPNRDISLFVPAGMWSSPPGWYKFPGYPPILPEQNRNLDPSTRGSG